MQFQVLRQDDDWLDEILGADWGEEEVLLREEHHLHEREAQPNLPTLTGVARSIRTLTYELNPVPGQEGGYEATPGTGQLRYVDDADPWLPEPPPSVPPRLAFAGWIVDVEEQG